MRVSGNLVLPDGVRRGTIEFSERIEGIHFEGMQSAADVDFGDAFIGPGFIDVHFHGAVGENFNECDEAGLRRILDYCASHGTTSCLAGVTTDKVVTISRAVDKIAVYTKSPENRRGATAALLGIHLEGPFLNPEVCGAMMSSQIIPADIELYKKWEESGVIRMITIAPEMPESPALMEYILSKGTCVLCAGHTAADYEEMMNAIRRGIRHVTHFYNAMTGFHHREPGGASAGIFSDATLELITDDVHVHPIMCRLVYEMKEPRQVCLVTDSVAAGGLPSGEYMANNRKVLVEDGRITLANGALAGSAHTMDRAVKNTARFVPVHDAWTMASYTPAKELGLLHERGMLKVGSIADFAVLDSRLAPKAAFVRGKMAWRA